MAEQAADGPLPSLQTTRTAAVTPRTPAPIVGEATAHIGGAFAVGEQAMAGTFEALAENAWDFSNPDGVPGFGPMRPTDDINMLAGLATGR